MKKMNYRKKFILKIILGLFFFSFLYSQPIGWKVVDRRENVDPKYRHSYYWQIRCADSLNCMIWAYLYGAGGYYFRRTTDGGETWNNVYMDSAWINLDKPAEHYLVPKLREIAYPNTKLFIAVGDSGVVLRSTDKGETWEKNIFYKKIDLGMLRMYDDKYGYMGGTELPYDSSSFIYKTVDGGKTWSKFDFHEPYKLGFEDIDIINKNLSICLIQYMEGQPYKRMLLFLHTDKGTWDTITRPDGGLGLDFIDEKTGWIYGGKSLDSNTGGIKSQIIHFTSDGGKTWSTQWDTLYNGFYMHGLKFFDENFGLASSCSGMILITTNGGKDWKEDLLYKIPNSSGAFGCIESIQIPSITTAYCIYDGDSIYKYTRYLSDVSVRPDISKEGITISPNPAEEYIEISGLNKGLQPLVHGQEIKIYNLLGECVLSSPIHPMSSRHRMYIESLPPGIYFIRLGDFVGRFLKI
jgi:hypothetical protein